MDWTSWISSFGRRNPIGSCSCLALIFTRNCGATTANSRQITIIPAWPRPFKNRLDLLATAPCRSRPFDPLRRDRQTDVCWIMVGFPVLQHVHKNARKHGSVSEGGLLLDTSPRLDDPHRPSSQEYWQKRVVGSALIHPHRESIHRLPMLSGPRGLYPYQET